ncbi:uncharacterized protein EV154DRAFT_479019 [Mucor mucedo]|uniref:uncharacterized protein n=1 Tax=Mucor mucedo TaxID=29922 RepID=UPI00221E6774|nr:uncharacterized protein EV154DRAFT_479019 [Mucor mucedo]KAI7893722.1 hypothetical protein EV154DRAFT_479019 [Mucor mucedo]
MTKKHLRIAENLRTICPISSNKYRKEWPSVWLNYDVRVYHWLFLTLINLFMKYQLMRANQYDKVLIDLRPCNSNYHVSEEGEHPCLNIIYIAASVIVLRYLLGLDFEFNSRNLDAQQHTSSDDRHILTRTSNYNVLDVDQVKHKVD